MGRPPMTVARRDALRALGNDWKDDMSTSRTYQDHLWARDLLEALDEIDRLSALVASRPPTHELRLEAFDWHGTHPIECPVAGCAVIDVGVADAMYDEFGPGDFVHDPATGTWAPKPVPVPSADEPVVPMDAVF